MTRLSLYLTVLALLAACAQTGATADAGTQRSSRGSSVVQGATPPVAATVAQPEVRVDRKRALGRAGAALAIVEFGDYQCPYCRSFHVSTFPQLQQDYVDTGKVRYFYKDFPLPNHSQAFSASIAAYCAGAQDRFWQMQDLLYTEQARLGAELYAELADELKLDIPRFKACLGSRAAARAVHDDVSEGRRLGVRGTPTFVLGRIEGDKVVVERMSTGAPAYEVFVRELETLAR